MGEKRRRSLSVLFLIIISSILILSWLHMFYRQALVPAGILGWGKPYWSDLPAHLLGAEEGGYSLVFFIYRVLLSISGDNVLIIAVFLTFIECITVAFNALIFYRYTNSWINALFLSILSLFTASVYIPVIQPYIYDGSVFTQSWHNDTSIIMKAFAVLTVYIYIEIYSISQGKVRDYLAFSIMLMITTACKPNFALIFYPYMGLMLIWCFVSKKEYLKRQFVMSLMLIPSFLVFVYQYWLTYANASTAEADGGVVIGLGMKPWELLVSPGGLLPIIFALPFPLFVLRSMWEDIRTDLFCKTAWMLYAIAIVENWLLHETGRRSHDGNFGWSIQIAAFMLMTASMGVFVKNYQKQESWIRYIGVTLVSIQLICGLLYYIMVACGMMARDL